MCRDGDSTGCLRIELELALPPKPTGTIGIVTTRVLLDELVRRVVRTAERTGVEVQGRIAVMSKHLVHTHTNNDPVAVVTTKPINCLAVQRRRVSENRWGQRWRQWRRQRGRAHSLSLQASSLRDFSFSFFYYHVAYCTTSQGEGPSVRVRVHAPSAPRPSRNKSVERAAQYSCTA
jgi:hypothetical protein